MGNFKVSFTTALFVFSFIVCVIVAVVFVDRSPRGDRDDFYEDETSARRDDAPADDDWNRRKEASRSATPAPSPAAPSQLIDLPIDSHLANASIPLPSADATVTPIPPANPTAGMSPEQAARYWMNQGKTMPPTPIPGLALPPGMTAPATATPMAQATTPPPRMPLQSNEPGNRGTGQPFNPFNAPGGLGQTKSSPGYSTSNIGAGSWPSVTTASPTPSSMMGVRSRTGGSNAGMSISSGKTERDVAPPPGFDGGITQEPAATPFSSSGQQSPRGTGSNTGLEPPPSLSTGPAPAPSGNSGGQLLYAPPSSDSNKYQLPPAPTLRPPPIQDPDQRRSDAGNPATDTQAPGGENPDGSGGQAFAISAGVDEVAAALGGMPPPGAAATPAAPADPGKVVVRVNDISLHEDEAARLAQAQALMEKKPITEDARPGMIKTAIDQWTAVTASAEKARELKLSVPEAEIERYAAMRPDFDVDAWKKALRESGFSDADIDEQLADLALSEKLLEHQVEEQNSDKDLEKLYKRNRAQYSVPRQVHVREIFKAKPENEDKAKAVASEMRRLQRQAASGTDFALLANQASESKTKSEGGDLGWITPAKSDNEALAKTVAELKMGGVSPVVETSNGYYIYKLLEDKPARDDFESGRELVVEKLKNEIRDKAFAEARESQEVELEPKGRVIASSKDRKRRTASAEGKTVEPPTAEPTPERRAASAAKPAAPATPAPPPPPTTQALAETGDAAKATITASGPAKQQNLAGGQPAPASQAGGQAPAAVQGLSSGAPTAVSAAPGQTNSLNPNAATTVNYPPGTTIQTNSGLSNPSGPTSSDELRREAEAMQAKAQAEEQARKRALDITLQRATGNAMAGSPGAPAAPAPAAAANNPGVADPAVQHGETGSTGLKMTARVRPVGAAPGSTASAAQGLPATGMQTGGLPPAGGPVGPASPLIQPPVADAPMVQTINMQEQMAQQQEGTADMVSPGNASGELTPQQFYEQMQTGGAAAGSNMGTGNAAQAEGQQESFQSNGWNVNKRVVNRNGAGTQGGPPSQENAQIPAGFEGSNDSTGNPQTQPADGEERRGIVGSVKNFFGGFKK